MGGSVRYGANEQSHKEGGGRFGSACVHICAESGLSPQVSLQFQACRGFAVWEVPIGHCRLCGLHPGLLLSDPLLLFLSVGTHLTTWISPPGPGADAHVYLRVLAVGYRKSGQVWTE